MKRPILFLAGVALILTLVGLRLSLLHKEQTPRVRLPAGPAQSVEQNAEQAARLSETRPVLPPVATDTNAPPPNAADIYRKAFVLLDALSDDERKIVDSWENKVDPAVEAELCEKVMPIAVLAHEAAAVTNCDWGADNATVEGRMPLFNQARALARATVWHAAHCRQDDKNGVADDLEATVRAGQSVSRFLIGHLVDTAIESKAMNYLAAHASALPGDVAARLIQLFGDGRYEESFFRALETEAEFASHFAERIEKPQQQQGDKVSPMAREQVAALVGEVAEWERDYVRALSLPEPEYQAWLNKLYSAQQTNPVLSLLWPALENVLEKTRVTVVQRAMISAGLALMQEAPNALENHLDPASGQAFVYRETGDGFELASTRQIDGKPVVMSFRTN